MFDVKAARERAELHVFKGSSSVLLRACDRIEALERENAAMAKVVAKVVEAVSRLSPRIDHNGAFYKLSDVDPIKKLALAAHAPATSKETP